MNRLQRKLDVTADTLNGCRFLDTLDRAERAKLARVCDGRRYRPGTAIVRHGEHSREVYFILAGRVQASLLSERGKLLTFQDLVGGDMFGELSAIDRRPRSTSVVAVDETAVVKVPETAFNELLERHPRLARDVLERVCALSRFLCEKAFECKAYSVPEQVRHEVARIVLARTAVRSGPASVERPPTQERIAHCVGTNREQVSRVMAEYEREGVIESSRQMWRVRDVSELVRALPGAFGLVSAGPQAEARLSE